jgi:glycosyltransferase involved in cell wall biosynthesis
LDGPGSLILAVKKASHMRVLWFTGVQLPALTGQSLMRAGWQEGLRKALEQYTPDVELGIVSFGSESHQPVVQGNATYSVIPRKIPHGKVRRIWKAWQHSSYTSDELDRCFEAVQSFKPDLVHFHGSENFFGLVNDRLSVPSVLSIQAVINGLQPFMFTDLGWKDILRNLVTRNFLRGDGLLHRWITSNKYCAIEKKILGSCQNYIGRTEWDRALLKTFNPAANYYHCDEVLAGDFYSLEWKNQNPDEEAIYSTGSNAFFKGGLTLARAVAVLKQRGRDNIRLRLAGIDTATEFGRALTALIAEQHLEKNIVLLGRILPQQITTEMLQASLFVLPSHMDNSPNSLCEAMLMGMPCIAAHVGGVPSLMRDGVDGLLYHDRDPFMLAEKIAQLLDDQALAVRLGAQARRTAVERHDPEKIAERTVQIYQQVISS